MTDKKPQLPVWPDDKPRVNQQVATTDVAINLSEALSSVFPFGGPTRLHGSTDFEGHRLNDMIDLVKNACPEHLTNAGEALFHARDAIRDAAEELKSNVGAVHWEGESGDAFRKWGGHLANNTHRLADFADVVAVQISAAGSGLASVRAAMPPRDHRVEQVGIADISPAKRIAGDAVYEAAVKVERDRQEAINQMNRLSSFYSVSEENLAAQDPPVFEVMPAVGVPEPSKVAVGEGPMWPVAGGARHLSTGGATVGHIPSGLPVIHARTAFIGSPTETVGQPTSPAGPTPNKSVGTEIDGVTLLAAPSQSQAAMTSTQPAPGVDRALAPDDRFSNPTVNGAARAIGSGHGPGMAATPRGPGRVTSRGSANPVGQVESPGPEGAKGGSTSAVRESPMGSGVTGGTHRFGGTVSPREDASGASASGRNGIVGGRPNFGAQGSAQPQRSRATVVGSKPSSSQPVPTGRPTQKGVMGAAEPSATGRARAGGCVKGNADGVVGVPQGRLSGKRGYFSGFTSGGSGLVRAARDEQALNDESEVLLESSDGDEELGQPRR